MPHTNVGSDWDDEEIARRLAAGESQTQLANEFGVSRTTIQRHAKAGQARIDAAEAEAIRRDEEERRVDEERERHVVTFSTRSSGAIFFDVIHRANYYWARSLESFADKCDWNSVRRGDVLGREWRAIKAGRPLYRYEPGGEPWGQAACAMR
jgi:hypothetical protein